MNKNAVQARTRDAAQQHDNAKHQQSSQNSRVLRAFTTLHVSGVFSTCAFEFGTGARRTGRRGAMHRRNAWFNHGLRGFALILIRHVKKD